MVVITIFAILVLAVVAKLIYDVQKNKNKQIEDEFVKDTFQKLAGIKPHNSQKGINDLADVLMKAEQIKKDGFPPESESIPMNSFPITKIKLNEDSDPLATIPMSRVSKEGRKKMAEIAKKDISDKLEENTANLHPQLKAEMENELNQMNKIVMGQATKPKRKYIKKTTK